MEATHRTEVRYGRLSGEGTWKYSIPAVAGGGRGGEWSGAVADGGRGVSSEPQWLASTGAGDLSKAQGPPSWWMDVRVLPCRSLNLPAYRAVRVCVCVCVCVLLRFVCLV